MFTPCLPHDGRPPRRRPLLVQRSCPGKELGQNPKGAATAPGLRHNGALTHEFVDESGNKSRFWPIPRLTAARPNSVGLLAA